MTARRIMIASKVLTCCALLATFGCTSTRALELAGGKQREDRILVSPQSHVCVSVHADARIWPQPPSTEVTRMLSGNLMARLRRIYEQRGGSDRMPGKNSGQRFHADPYGIDPDCRSHGVDVFVKVQYGPRENGRPFLLRYWITRGSSVRSGYVDVSVAEEIRAGRIEGYSRERTDGVIIAEDTLLRAELIASQLAITSH